MRIVTLWTGQQCTLATYIQSWSAVKRMPAGQPITLHRDIPRTREDILRFMADGIHDRINRNDSSFRQGRLWDAARQAEMQHFARQINTPRLVIDWVPPCLRKHRHRMNIADRMR